MIGNVSSFVSTVYKLHTTSPGISIPGAGTEHSDKSGSEIHDTVEITSNIKDTIFNREGLAKDNNIHNHVQEKDRTQTAGDRPEEGNKHDSYVRESKGAAVNDYVHLSPQEKKEIEALQKRDREVRQHEQAHLAAAGQYANGVSYTTKVGPDGRHYAVGGEVSIDLSEVSGNPEATIAKAQAIRRAANAPANPSSQDRLVAANATRMEAKARIEKIEQENEEEQKVAGDVTNSDSLNMNRAFSAYSGHDDMSGSLLNKRA